MAEAVGLFASCLSVAGLAHSVLKLMAELKSLARDHKTIESDLSKAIHTIKWQVRTIHDAQAALRRYCKRSRSARAGQQQRHSSMIVFLANNSDSEFLQIESSRIQGDIDDLLRHVKGLDSWLRIVAVYAWRRFVRKGFESIRNDLMYVQQNITLIYHIVILELLLRESERNMVQIKHLKRVIKGQERAIKNLRKQRRREGLTSPDGDASTGPHLEHRGVDEILDIAQTVRTEENLPARVDPHPLAPEPSPSPRSSPTPEPQPRPEQHHAPFTMPQDPRPHPAAGRIKHPYLLPSRPSPPSETGSGSSGHARTVRPVSSARQSQRSVSPGSASAASRRSRASTHGTPEADTPRSNTDNRHGDGDFIAVRPADMVLQMVESRTYERIPGQITSADGTPHEVWPILEPQQNFNSMTEREARQLGVMDAVEPYVIDPIDGDRWVESANGQRIRPTGTVLVRWSTTVGLRPITLLFWVFPGYLDKRSIVLGRPYVEKSSHYLTSGPGPSSGGETQSKA